VGDFFRLDDPAPRIVLFGSRRVLESESHFDERQSIWKFGRGQYRIFLRGNCGRSNAQSLRTDVTKSRAKPENRNLKVFPQSWSQQVKSRALILRPTLPSVCNKVPSHLLEHANLFQRFEELWSLGPFEMKYMSDQSRLAGLSIIRDSEKCSLASILIARHRVTLNGVGCEMEIN